MTTPQNAAWVFKGSNPATVTRNVVRQTHTRAAGVAWCAGFGRLGGVAGPAVGGLITTLGLTGGAAFYVFGGVALFGAGITQLVRRQKDLEEIGVVQREQRQTQDA